jgi:DNA-directed RNA polymerase specialized sigma24 family protein
MPDDRDVLDRLERYARAIAFKLLRRYDLQHDHGRIEDITQVLFIAGEQVWRETRNVGLAKHRMSTRAKNAEEKLQVDLRQPQPLSSLHLPQSKERDDVDATEAYHAESTDMPYRRMRVGPVVRSSPDENMIVQEYLASLTERQRQIVQYRGALMDVPEIAKAMNISERTVERELAQIRRDYPRD